MDMVKETASPAGTTDNDRQIALLNWATTKLDNIAGHHSTQDNVSELLDCMAYFTREHFGFQERLLKDCSEHRAYLMERMAVHGEFRRRLAQIYLDAMRGDLTVAQRLSSLCHEIWLDIQTQQEAFAKIVGNRGEAPKTRRKTRPAAIPFRNALRFDT
jgi:hemerythrin